MGDVLTYKEQLNKIMLQLAGDKRVRFIGYNTRYGHQFNGTLKGCEKSAIEMPVAENLIMGVAMGMAMQGFRPVVCIERMDFLWACADAIVNHLNKARQLGWGPLNVIIRTCVGSDKPLDPGCQHKNNYTQIMKALLSEVEVREARTSKELRQAYNGILKHEGAVMIVEYKSSYEAKR